MLRWCARRQTPWAHKMPRLPHTLVLAMLGLSQSGCSIISPMPIWELAKATGGAASMAVKAGPGQASGTVFHPHEPFKELCIEFNPQTQVTDLVPALQAALRTHHIESRVYEHVVSMASCSIWLTYSAYIDWDMPPLSDQYKPYVSTAALTLQTAKGRVLSSSHYELDPAFGSSKWATTRDKLAPVVAALITGTVH